MPDPTPSPTTNEGKALQAIIRAYSTARDEGSTLTPELELGVGLIFALLAIHDQLERLEGAIDDPEWRRKTV